MPKARLHVYQLHGSVIDSDYLLEHVSNSVQLPHLRSCTLSGMKVREETLTCFLRTFPSLQSLELRKIDIGDGFWGPIFEHCCGETSYMENLAFCRLAERGPIVFDSHTGQHEAFYLSGEELKKGIVYRPAPRTTLRRLNNQLRLEYGPPGGVPGRTRFVGVGGGW